MTDGSLVVVTLALGGPYRRLARLLAGDLDTHHPGLDLLVLTDDPGDFTGLGNVTTIRHRQRAIWHPFHDKRFALAAGLTRTRSCIFLDADTRLLGPIQLPPEGDQAGVLLVDRAIPMVERHQMEIAEFRRAGRRDWPTPPPREWRLVQAAHRRFEVRPEETFFVQEHLLAVARDQGREEVFFSTWAVLARYFELRGFSFAEGNAIGVAARVAGWEVRGLGATRAWLFKYNRTAERRFAEPVASRIREYRETRRALTAAGGARRWPIGRAAGCVLRLLHTVVGPRVSP